jgi:putative DNA primase/helicase
MYKDGVYVNGARHIEHEMIRIIPNLSSRHRSEVLKYLDLIVREEPDVAPAHLIAFKNGIYNMETDEFIDFSPEFVITNKIPWNYNPNAYFEVTDRTLNNISCHDENVRSLLEEGIGYTFYRRNELRKAFILVGDKANGKSTYLDMIKNLLGIENVCALDLKELGERFKTALISGKLANIGDDIGDEFIPNPAIFKKLVSGDSINAERKGQDPFDFTPYAKFLFSANDIPRIKDKSGAVLSRLVIVPFDARFSKSDPDFDPYIKYKLRKKESMEYLIQLGIKGLKRVLENSSFTQSKRVAKQIEEYNENNNPILIFFKERTIEDFENHPTKDVFQDYCGFCHANGFTPLSNVEFSKHIKKKYDLKSSPKWIDGKTIRVYAK